MLQVFTIFSVYCTLQYFGTEGTVLYCYVNFTLLFFPPQYIPLISKCFHMNLAVYYCSYHMYIQPDWQYGHTYGQRTVVENILRAFFNACFNSNCHAYVMGSWSECRYLSEKSLTESWASLSLHCLLMWTACWIL